MPVVWEVLPGLGKRGDWIQVEVCWEDRLCRATSLQQRVGRWWHPACNHCSRWKSWSAWKRVCYRKGSVTVRHYFHSCPFFLATTWKVSAQSSVLLLLLLSHCSSVWCHCSCCAFIAGWARSGAPWHVKGWQNLPPLCCPLQRKGWTNWTQVCRTYVFVLRNGQVITSVSVQVKRR